MERRYEVDRMRCRCNGNELQTREMRQLRNRQHAQLRAEELLLNLTLGSLRNDNLVAMFQPHAGGGGFGDVSVVEVMGEFEAVAPAADDEGKSENRKNARLEEAERCELQGRELRSGPRLEGVLWFRDGERFGQISLGSSYRSAKVSQV